MMIRVAVSDSRARVKTLGVSGLLAVYSPGDVLARVNSKSLRNL
jgi:hypothetical protein